MNKYLLTLSLLLTITAGLYADRLEDQLRFLIPDEGGDRKTERQFFRRAFNDLVGQLEADKLGRQSTKKIVSRIRERIKNNFLREYVRGAELADFFRFGRYNDVSLALVYSLLLEHFDVSHFGKIDHWEAGILADPEGEKVWLSVPGRVKRGDPKEKAFRYDYVELLNLTVLPGRRPTSGTGVDSLFQRFHYGPKERLDFSTLSAYWHYQRAMLRYERGEYVEVIRTLGQARKRDDRAAFSALEQATYLQLAEMEGEDGKQALFYFFELWRKNPDNTYIPSALLTSFVYATNPLLHPGESFGKGEQLYQFMDSRGAHQPAWRNQLRELYYLQKSRYFAAQKNHEEVMAYVDSLYVLQPEHPVFQKFVGSLSLQSIRSSGARGRELKAMLDQLTLRYPFLLYHPAINDMLLADQARNIRDLYDADNSYQGDSQLAIFRTQLSQAPADDRRSLWVLTAYIAASNYYYRYYEYAQARRLIEEALRFAPKDPYLDHRLDLLRRY